MTDPAKLRAEDHARLTAIYQRCPILQTLASHVRDFATMVRDLTGTDLPQWIDNVLADVTAGLTLPWSSGAVEGQVNRVTFKMIKRQMYGRANFDLLRRRILQPN